MATPRSNLRKEYNVERDGDRKGNFEVNVTLSVMAQKWKQPSEGRRLCRATLLGETSAQQKIGLTSGLLFCFFISPAS